MMTYRFEAGNSKKSAALHADGTFWVVSPCLTCLASLSKGSMEYIGFSKAIVPPPDVKRGHRGVPWPETEDCIWMETGKPILVQAMQFAQETADRTRADRLARASRAGRVQEERVPRPRPVPAVVSKGAASARTRWAGSARGGASSDAGLQPEPVLQLGQLGAPSNPVDGDRVRGCWRPMTQVKTKLLTSQVTS